MPSAIRARSGLVAQTVFALVAPFLLMLLLATVTGCRDARGAAPAASPAVPVHVADAMRPGDLAITATGTLGAKDEIPLAFKMGGVVARIAVDEGARVRAGQVLAELDLREIDALVAKATAAAQKAGRDAARAERLQKDSVLTLAQLQDAQTMRDVAEADLRAARMNREYAAITAPTDGVVLARGVNPGAQVAPGMRVLLLGSSARGAVLRAGVPDRDALRVRVGDATTVTFDAAPGRTVAGRVRQVAAAADARTGTYTVEVALDGAADLPSGLVGRVRISSGAGRAAAGTASAGGAGVGVLAIPAEALVEGAGECGTVFVLDATGTVALRRAVVLAGLDGERVLVRGLAPGTRVVTAGAAWLKDSTRVEIAK
jgi:multidrug efflux system membrane fusion protein